MGRHQVNAKKTGVLVFSWVLFVVYMITLSYFLFFSEYYGRTTENPDYRYNLRLFTEIRRFIIYRQELGWKAVVLNLFGNVAAFIPVGFILPMLSKKNAGFLRILLMSLFISLLIEFLQLYYHVGIFDVDDMLLNTCGGVLGYALYTLKRVCIHKK